jgi:hypothetical protein
MDGASRLSSADRRDFFQHRRSSYPGDERGRDDVTDGREFVTLRRAPGGKCGAWTNGAGRQGNSSPGGRLGLTAAFAAGSEGPPR